jgi:hypothetical protein
VWLNGGIEVLGHPVLIDCDDEDARHVLEANFGALARLGGGSDALPPKMIYVVRRAASGRPFSMSCRQESPLQFDGLGELLYAVEKDLVVSLQRQRPELLFLHSAVLERAGRGYLLVGDSGSGKSTTTWGLLHHGFSYLSDELAPIDPATMQVHAYPHALCMKRKPPPAYPLPSDGVQYLASTLHVPVANLPARLGPATCAVEAIVFVQHDRALTVPRLRRLGSAEAGARLYTTALNALAHPDNGLDVVLKIASHARCYLLHTADLEQSCELFCDEVVGTP